jgi:hypothetical protein
MSHARFARLAPNLERGFAAQKPECFSAAFGDIRLEADRASPRQSSAGQA